MSALTDCCALLQPGRRHARQIIRAFGDRGGDVAWLRLRLLMHCISISSRAREGLDDYARAVRAREKAHARFEEAAGALLAFYSAKEHSPQWMAVYCGNAEHAGENADRIRAALDGLRHDPALRSAAPRPRAAHRPQSHAAILRSLRALDFRRDDAREVIRSLRRG